MYCTHALRPQTHTETHTERVCLAPVKMRALSAVCFLLLALSSVRCSASQVEVRALDTWRLEVRWNASGASRTHEVQVARTSRFEGNVSARAPFNTWVWKSELPLQCADNSVRVRSVFNSTAVSAWSQWATNHGKSAQARLFPMEEVLQEGTSGHFCCIPPAGAQVTEIRFKNKPYTLTPVDEQVRAIEVLPLQFQQLPVNLACKDSSSSRKDQTVVNYITFPPEKPQNLSCMTKNLQIITCKWECGQQLDVDHPLHSDEAEVQCGVDLLCNFAALPNRSFYNISVVMRNALGEESQSYAFNISHRGTAAEGQFVVSEPEQSLRATVQLLQPSSQYSTTVRCALQGNDWGLWSSNTSFSTGQLSEHISLFVQRLLGAVLAGETLLSLWWLITEPMLKEKRIVGNPEGFLLSWSALSSATCGYAVEWCVMGNAEPCDLRWRKVSANQTSLSLSAGTQAGHRYTFRIFSCQTEGHRVHEKHTGYLEEQGDAPELSYSLSIFWSSMLLQWSFNEEDSEHPGFITGYRLTIQEHADWTYRIWNISVEDPHRKSETVEGVKEGQRYTIQLAACTRAGCGLESVHTITTPQNHYLLMAKVMTPLLILIGCCFCLWPLNSTAHPHFTPRPYNSALPSHPFHP
uniref:Oncostatin M receptor n=1 Tax=Pygocentrus nattereri TaxID=42514 RepID=A0A3B4CF47_PYGNA